MKEIRTCIACRSKHNKKDLIRIVVDNEGRNIIDTKHIYNSRGVYICNKKECILRILKLKDVTKVLKIKTTKEEFMKVICELGEKIH